MSGQYSGGDASRIKGGTDETIIGNISDKLKVTDQDVYTILLQVANGSGITIPAIFKRNEISVASRTETDMPNTTYTVPAGKTFVVSSFSASYDAQVGMYVRLKKQTGGAGAWETLFRLNMMLGGQGNSTVSLDLSKGIEIGVAGDVFKITYESTMSRGTLWASYSGSQI